MPAAKIPYFSGSERVCIVCGEPATLLGVTSVTYEAGQGEEVCFEGSAVDLCGIKCAGYIGAALARRFAFMWN